MSRRRPVTLGDILGRLVLGIIFVVVIWFATLHAGENLKHIMLNASEKLGPQPPKH